MAEDLPPEHPPEQGDADPARALGRAWQMWKMSGEGWEIRG